MKNKNIGPFLAFTEEWFKKHQKTLLWLLNTPIISRWFRYVLRIRKYDCSIKTKISEIAPNRFTYNDHIKDGKRIRTTDFRTHPKFAKRIYFAFKPMWWALHFWDWLVADRFVPQWSFGFDTLTVFPDNGVTTIDGDVSRTGVNQTWANIIAGAGNAHGNDYAFTILSSATVNQFAQVGRSIYLFDTSALSASATISAAVLSLKGQFKEDTFTVPSAPDCQIYTSTPASNTTLADADYGQIGTVAQTDTAVTYANLSESAYVDFTFNATGIGNISKTSISKFAAKNANHDAASSAPTWSISKSAGWEILKSSTSGTSSDPKLVITYTGGSIDISISDAITVAESVTLEVNLNPSVSDSITLTEATTIELINNISVSDLITLTESVNVEQVFGLSVFDAVTVTESVTLSMDLGDIAVNDTVTITESVNLDMLIDVVTSDAITVSESVTLEHFFNITVNDDVVVLETVPLDGPSLNPSVFDTVTITESVTRTISAMLVNVVYLRSNQQQYPLAMDERKDSDLRNRGQSNPFAMDNDDII